MEDLAYRRLLDVYYMREGVLPADIQQAAKLVRLRSCAGDVESVLREFFTLTEDGWRHSRCDAEIAKMQDKQEKARASGIASANARKAYAERTSKAKPTDAEQKSMDVERSLGESSTDVQLPTPTPTPTPTPVEEGRAPRKRSTPAMAKPDDVDQQTWTDWLTLRKAKRAPVTQTTLDGAREEAAKAGMQIEVFLKVWCRRGSQGLEADWLQPNEKNAAMTSNRQALSFAERDELARHKRYTEMTGRPWPTDSADVIDITPNQRIAS
jgi:uncharacterized protein YdaU (DUF1376 family)